MRDGSIYGSAVPDSLASSGYRAITEWRYATTIHKSQGSEYPVVVIPVLSQHCAMLQRNLLYTGVTRGKRLVIMLGQKKAVAMAVKNTSGRRRWSKLRDWLAVF